MEPGPEHAANGLESKRHWKLHRPRWLENPKVGVVSLVAPVGPDADLGLGRGRVLPVGERARARRGAVAVGGGGGEGGDRVVGDGRRQAGRGESGVGSLVLYRPGAVGGLIQRDGRPRVSRPLDAWRVAVRRRVGIAVGDLGRRGGKREPAHTPSAPTASRQIRERIEYPLHELLLRGPSQVPWPFPATKLHYWQRGRSQATHYRVSGATKRARRRRRRSLADPCDFLRQRTSKAIKTGSRPPAILSMD